MLTIDPESSVSPFALSPSTPQRQAITDLQHTTQCLLLRPLRDRALVTASLFHLHPRDDGIPSHPSSFQRLQIQLVEKLAHLHRV